MNEFYSCDNNERSCSILMPSPKCSPRAHHATPTISPVCAIEKSLGTQFISFVLVFELMLLVYEHFPQCMRSLLID